MKDPPRILPIWEEALKAKFMGIGKPFGRVEFDKLLGEHDVCLAIFCSTFLLLPQNS
jgi:hypothetical protein